MSAHRLIQVVLVVLLLVVPSRSDADTRDWEGLKRDTWYFMGYQWVTIGVLYVASENVSNWTDEQKESRSLSKWWDNVTHPQIDSDDFYINYVLHPYWGAAYFVRAQERGYNDYQAFWYSAALSSAYEFGAEALFEEPSIQDLFVTPVFGSLLGKYFMQVRDNIEDREAKLGYRSRKDKFVWVMTDPLGSLNNKFDDWFGLDSRLQVRPFTTARRPPGELSFGPHDLNDDKVYGVEFRFEW